MTNKIDQGWSARDKIDSCYRGYAGPDCDYQTSISPPLPTSSTAFPMWSENNSFLEYDACKESDSTPSEVAFQWQHRQPFRKQFVKTQLCRYHLNTGCRKGANCEFAHGQEELTASPDLRHTSICVAWQGGNCPFTADTCRFAHGHALLRRTSAFDGETKFDGREFSDAPPPSTTASGSIMREGLPRAAKLFTSWEQQLLRQQVEHQQMKETIEEQQKTIDALLRLHVLGRAASEGQHKLDPIPVRSTEYPQQMHNSLSNDASSTSPPGFALREC